MKYINHGTTLTLHRNMSVTTMPTRNIPTFKMLDVSTEDGLYAAAEMFAKHIIELANDIGNVEDVQDTLLGLIPVSIKNDSTPMAANVMVTLYNPKKDTYSQTRYFSLSDRLAFSYEHQGLTAHELLIAIAA